MRLVVTVTLAVLTAGCFNEPGPPAPEDHLVVWWKLDETVGPGFHDWSGSGRDGTTAICGHGGTWVPGRFANALQLDLAENQCGGPLEAAGFDLQGGWSVSAWVKLASIPPSGKNYAVVVKPTGSGELLWNYALIAEGTNGGFEAAFDDTNGTHVTAQVLGSLVADEWIHLTGTWDGTTLTAYVGAGIARMADAGGKPQYGSPMGPIAMLGQESCCGNFLDGTLDDVRIYSRALSASEVSSLDVVP